MKKKTVLLVALMSVCATLLLIAGVTFAANAEPVGGDCGVYGDNVKWEFNPDSGELRIYGEGEMEDYSMGGSTPWYSYNNQIKSITIEYGVTSIGDHAFPLFKELENVTIPESVTSIGKEAFDYCEKLSEITIPNSVTTIGDDAFQGCTNLSNVTMPERMMNLGLGTFQSCSNLTNITIPDGITSIEADTFQSCWNLTDVTIPDSVTSIGDSAFLGCHSLTSIIIPNGVTSIGREAFRWCNNVTSISLPGSVTSIGLYAFSGCSGLEILTVSESNPKYFSSGNCLIEKESGTLIQGFNDSSRIPVDGSVTSIGDYAFRECEMLTNIIIPDSITSIGEGAFEDTNLINITIPESVESIGDAAFCGCDSLTDVIMPDNMMYLGSSAFCNCTSLTSITIPYGVTDIYSNTFERCPNLTNVIIPDSVRSIGNFAFSAAANEEGINNLTNIIIPNSVTSIGDGAFAYCNLIEITIPNSVTSIGDNAFQSCYDLKTVYIDSPDVAKDKEEKDIYDRYYGIMSGSYLISHADTVYINSTITEISDYITTNFPYTHTAVHDGTAYMAYSKTPIVHDTLEGYIQFRPGDGVYDARVLVEGKSDFMEDYASATVTLTFTKNGDSNKTLTMTALADRAYTSVTACGQRKDARPGYGFIGLVITGIGNADVGTISASVTLTSADGDTVTYELGRVDNVPDYVGHPIA